VAVAPLLLGSSQAAIAALGGFAGELGLLFQIVDDILDVTGSEEELGKPAGSDQRHGKRTYVSVFGLDRARELAAGSHERARGALADAQATLGGDAADLGLLVDFIRFRSS
jgi:geranylgeranyl diphosphate synthase, type II